MFFDTDSVVVARERYRKAAADDDTDDSASEDEDEKSAVARIEQLAAAEAFTFIFMVWLLMISACLLQLVALVGCRLALDGQTDKSKSTEFVVNPSSVLWRERLAG